MSQEEKATLRLFCEATDCQVWKAIQKAEEGKEEQTPLRKHCAEVCFAYKYNRWVGLVNKQIIDLNSQERYK
jgi:hypothetical protein